MKTLRITVIKPEMDDLDEHAFNERLVTRFRKAGFNLDGVNIIRQERSDHNATDFIQFQYTLFDSYLVEGRFLYHALKKWLKHQFSNQDN